MITALRAMVRKDLRLFFGDRRAMIMSFAAPIAIGAFFGYIFGGNGGSRNQNSQIEIMAVDQDQSDISKQILEQLGANKALDVKSSTADEARAAVRKGSASVAIVIPEHFGQAAGRAFFSASDKPQIDVLVDPSRTAEQGMVQGVLTGAVMQAVSKEMFSGKMGRQMTSQALAFMGPNAPSGLADLLSAVNRWNQENAADGAGAPAGLTVPYQIHEEAVTARKGVQYNGYAHSFGGMGVQFILFMGIDAGITVLLQRQRGLWKRLRAAPLSRGLLLGGRALSSALISMLIFLVIFGVARVVFGVRIEGSFPGFLAVCAAFSMMTATFGLLIAALGRTPEATRGIASFVTLIMVMLGGAWVPSFIFPQWLQTITLAMPTRWAMDALDGTVWRGLGFSSVLWPVAGLLATAAVFGFLAVSRFRWDIEG